MIAVGDIHEELETLEKILKKFRSEKLIFLGDIVDRYTSKNKNKLSERNLEEFFGIRERKDSVYALQAVLDRTSETIILAGNHEYNYAGPFVYYFKHQLKMGEKVLYPYCKEGFDESQFSELNKLIEKNKERFGLAHYEKSANMLFTHAGVTKGWLEWYKRERNDLVSAENVMKILIEKKPFNISMQDPVFEVETDKKNPDADVAQVYRSEAKKSSCQDLYGVFLMNLSLLMD